MTKKEAMAFAISAGKPIRHNSFSKGEFVRYKGKELVDEEGTILPQQEFWTIRSGGFRLGPIHRWQDSVESRHL